MCKNGFFLILNVYKMRWFSVMKVISFVNELYVEIVINLIVILIYVNKDIY